MIINIKIPGVRDKFHIRVALSMPIHWPDPVVHVILAESDSTFTMFSALIAQYHPFTDEWKYYGFPADSENHAQCVMESCLRNLQNSAWLPGCGEIDIEDDPVWEEIVSVTMDVGLISGIMES